jgi:hypothetical protein
MKAFIQAVKHLVRGISPERYNRERSALMAEALYWEIMEHLMILSP